MKQKISNNLQFIAEGMMVPLILCFVWATFLSSARLKKDIYIFSFCIILNALIFFFIPSFYIKFIIIELIYGTILVIQGFFGIINMIEYEIESTPDPIEIINAGSIAVFISIIAFCIYYL